MTNGKVVGWRPDKGFGFIRPEGGGDDVFFHVRDLKGIRSDEIAIGQDVSYQVQQGPKGPQAKAVRFVSEEAKGGARPTGYRFLNPYNFIRYLERPKEQNGILGRCAPPPHDRYVGLTGRITCTLVAQAPLFISDAHAVAESTKEKKHRTYRFFELDGQPALPASSLRGMIRSVFEAVTNSCFSIFHHDDPYPLEYREARAPEMIPARVVELNGEGGTLELLDCTRDAPVDCSGRPTVTRAAAVAHAYPPRVLDQRSDPPRPYYPDRSLLPQNARPGMPVAALVTKQPQTHRTGRYRSFIAHSVVPVDQANTIEESDGRVRVTGWLHFTGPNIENKHDERLFFRWPGSKPVLVSFNTRVVPEYNHHLKEYWERNRRKVEQLGNEPWSQDSLPHPSSFVREGLKLQQGDLVYALLDSREQVGALRPVSMPRLRYRTRREQLLPVALRRCDLYAALCPACRLFGWVHAEAASTGKSDRAAYAGRVRFAHGKPVVETLRPVQSEGITLAILASPKPTTTRFYLMPLSGRPRDGLDDLQAGYDGPNKLRGRKIYRHQGKARPFEYQRKGNKQDDQNRTVIGVLDKGSSFTFAVDFENLAEIELSALIWSLEIEGMNHRLGFAKPLGFGSVKITVAGLELVNPSIRYSSLSKGGWLCIEREEWTKWVQGFKDSLARLYGQTDFGQLSNVQDLIALLSDTSSELPIHYPRSDDIPDEKGQNFEWFMGNKRGLRLALPIAPDDHEGLPLLGRDGVPRK